MSTSAPFTREFLEELESSLLYLDDCDVECDGMTYAISYLLGKAGIAHARKIGHVECPQTFQVVHPHCWIELDADTVIDFRLRMWLGDEDRIPHGVFRVSEHDIRYTGQIQDRPIPTPAVLALMTNNKLKEVTLQPPG